MPLPSERPEWFIVDSSKIQDFMTCPRYTFFRHVCGWSPDEPNNHLVFGSAWHEAMEHLLLNGYGNKSLLDAYSKLETLYRKSFSQETDEIFYPKTPANALVALTGYVKKWENDQELYETIYTEIGGTVSIGDHKDIYYRMDSVLKRKSDGKLGSREHKTGSSTYNWLEQWPLSFQVGTYNHVLNCLYDQTSIYGVEMNGAIFGKSVKGWPQLIANQPLSVKDPREYIRCTILKNRSQMQSWLTMANWWYDSYMAELEAMNDVDGDDEEVMYSFQCNPKSCLNYGRLCVYHDFCLAWANPIRKLADVPIGFKQEFWNPLAEAPKHTFNLE